MKASRKISLSYGMVNIPVCIAPLVKGEKVSGHHVCAEHRKRLSQQMVCPDCGGPVAKENKTTGYEFGGALVVPGESTLRGIESEKDKVFQIDTFVRVDDVDPLLYDKSYWLWPDGKANSGFLTLTEVMRQDRLAAVGTVVLGKTPTPALLRYSELAGGLVMDKLHFAADVRLTQVPRVEGSVSEMEVAQARAILGGAVSEFDASQYRDEHQDRLVSLLQNLIGDVEQVEQQQEPVYDFQKALAAAVAERSK